MKTDKQAICIYGASSNDIDHVYKESAREAGRLIALAGRTLVCGGGKAGVMAAAIEGASAAGGVTIGVLPAFMVERGWQHPDLTHMECAADMHARKERMAALCSAAIAFPGGCGTLEELLEIITWRQLGLFDGNVVIANINGYYDPLIQMLERTIEQAFMHPDHATLWRVATSATEAVEMALAPCDHRSFTQKIK